MAGSYSFLHEDMKCGCVCENFKYRKCTLLQKMCTGDYTCVCMPVYERMLHFTLPTN